MYGSVEFSPKHNVAWASSLRPARMERLPCVRHTGPNCSALCTLHCSRDEQHPFHAIFHGGEIAVGGNRLAIDLRLNSSRSFQIDVRKSLDKSFWMPSRE